MAAAMLAVVSAVRIKLMAVLRRVAMTRAAVPVRTWERSSSKVTSRTFSGGQPADRVPRLGVFPLFVG